MSLVKNIALIIFVISCFATSGLSFQLLGSGPWGWLIVGAGVYVGISFTFPAIASLGKLVVFILSVFSVAAVVLGFIAATAGGSFNMDDSSALLLFLFFMIAVSGFSLLKVSHKPDNS